MRFVLLKDLVFVSLFFVATKMDEGVCGQLLPSAWIVVVSSVRMSAQMDGKANSLLRS